MNQNNTRKPKRSAMTLLELILALFIASIVMIAIGMAIQLQAMTLDSRRSVVEEVQLARAILRQISDDLRSSARYEVLTISDSSEALSTGGAPSSSSATPSTGGASTTGGASSGDSTTPTTDQASTAVDNLDVQNSTSTTSIPGIFGNQNQLQIDLSRLPRIDEYQPVLASVAGQMTSVPSGYRTVAYYLGSQTDPNSGIQTSGLMRRELDRTITEYATQSGNLLSINSQGELLATEVVNIEFRYFDGQQYLLQWDTANTTALPLAVEVNIWLKAPVNGRNATAKDEVSTKYRMVVAIPTGEYPPDLSASSTTTPEGGSPETGGAASGGGATGGASGGGTSGGAGGS